LIDCVNFGERGKDRRHNKYIDNPQFDVEALVKVIGRLNDPNVKYLRWFEILTLMRDVYSKPFILPPNNMTLIYNIIDDKIFSNKDKAELINDISDEEESSD
ncbi:29661_t:CDS:2, partial [Racocetra persica]